MSCGAPSLRWRWAPAAALALALQALAAHSASGGPPFRTDDPEPVAYRHWEIYLAGEYEHGGQSVSGTLPRVEVNYGPLPNVQLAISLPLAFAQAPNAPVHVGYGDTELGLKVRFLQETRRRPQVGFYPLLDVPTASASAGLGSGLPRTFLPIWLQKSSGHWTTYGGLGRWHNPGPGNRDWWYGGWTVERELSNRVTLGAEVFHETPETVDGRSTTGFDLGLIAGTRGPHNLLFAVGRALHGDTALSLYAAYELKLGPQAAEHRAASGEQKPEH
jgi:hypothetical protein